MNYKCNQCGVLVTKIEFCDGRKVCCDAAPTVYWTPSENPTGEIYTPNGEHHSCSFEGDSETAAGLGYIPHKCVSETGKEVGE